MSFQTPGGPAAKRRRIEAANVTLRKPFRSPLIGRQQTEVATADGTQNSPTVGRASPAASATPRIPATPVPARSSRGTAGGAVPAPSPLSTSPSLSAATSAAGGAVGNMKRIANPASRSARVTVNPVSGSASIKVGSRAATITTPTTGSKAGGHDKDDLLQQIVAFQREMAAQLRETQTRLDLVRQARRIEEAAFAKRSMEEGVDGELREMIGRWKTASRLAAEELFELIKDRVAGMGGAKAWRESRKRQRDYYGGFEEEAMPKGGGEGEEGLGNLEVEREEDEGEEEQEEETGESEFTMLMMLKSLNIEPEVLGYDIVEDKWKD